MTTPNAPNGPFDLDVEGRYVIRTDPHTHILPALDDGSRNMAMSLEMARKAVANGTQNIVAMPHACHPAAQCDYTSKEIRGYVSELNSVLQQHEIPLTIYPGMEMLMDESIPNLLETGDGLTWADQGKYLLVELGFQECRSCTWEVLDFVSARGLIPIIAHPERYHWIHSDAKSVAELEERGCYFQVNVMSLCGFWGENALQFALNLMRRTPRWIIGTDSHSDHPKFWEIDSVRNLLIREQVWTGQGEPRVSESAESPLHTARKSE